MADDEIPKPTFGGDGLDEVEYQAVASAYFQNVVNQGTAARQRAQAGFAVVSAIAGAVVAFSLSSTIAGSTGLTKAFTYTSLSFWAICAILFLAAAILQPATDPPNLAEQEAVRAFPSSQKTEDGPSMEGNVAHVESAVVASSTAKAELLSLRPVGFVAYVFRLSKRDAFRVSWWTILAGWTAGLAIVALLGTAGSLLFDNVGVPQSNAIVAVNGVFFNQFEARCEVRVVRPTLRDLVGQVETNSLIIANAPYVDFQSAPGTCDSSGHFIIPRSDIVSIEEYSCPLTDVAVVSETHYTDPLVPCADKATPFKDIYRFLTRSPKRAS